MRVEIRIAKDIKENYAVIHTDKVTDEVEHAMAVLEGIQTRVLTATDNERVVVLQSDEVYMVRVENEKTILYGEKRQFQSRKRLYELEENLGKDFLRISKSTLVNLKYLDYVEPTFSGLMLLKLKNQCQDYVSRKYLPELKRYLGL